MTCADPGYWDSKDHEVLHNLVEWSNKWQLGFNETKCKSLHLGSSNQRLNYQMNSVIVVYITVKVKFVIFEKNVITKSQ